MFIPIWSAFYLPVLFPPVFKLCIGIVQVEVIIELIIRVRESNRLEQLN